MQVSSVITAIGRSLELLTIFRKIQEYKGWTTLQLILGEVVVPVKNVEQCKSKRKGESGDDVNKQGLIRLQSSYLLANPAENMEFIGHFVHDCRKYHFSGQLVEANCFGKTLQFSINY